MTSQHQQSHYITMTSHSDLGDDIEVGYESALQHDGDVGGIEELDGVGAVLPAVASTLDRKVHSEALGAFV